MERKMYHHKSDEFRHCDTEHHYLHGPRDEKEHQVLDR